MTRDQLEALILAIPVPRRSEDWPAYRARCRAIEKDFSDALMVPLDLEELDALVEDSRPSGVPFDGQSWDSHFARVESIEQSLRA